MTGFKTKVLGSIKNVSSGFVKVGDTWKSVATGYTKVNGVWKEFFSSFPKDAVDLGLPSGTLWAKGNIIHDGTGYKIGEETDYGAYVSWGNVTPHFLSSNRSTFEDGYNWGSSVSTSPYSESAGATVSFTSQHRNADYTPDSGYDAAYELLGNNWRIPTAIEFQELCDNCTTTWVTKSGVSGREFTSNINGERIFFPATGIGKNTSNEYVNTRGYYWSSSLYSAERGYSLYIDNSGPNYSDNSRRFYGFTVRAVYNN